MGFFRWAAPMFGHFADRWGPDDMERITGWLRPYVTENGRLLDLAGGTGALAARLADSLGRPVTVLDATPEMLAYLPERDDVDGVQGCAEKMPFPNDTFDAVVVSDAFHHFRDQDAAVREIQRVTRCAGGVLLLEFDPSGLMRLIVLAEKMLGEPGAFYTPAEMCTFMAERGIDGECEKLAGISYRFLGTVREL